MKKNFFHKAITMVIAFILVFALTATAFASYVDYATWSSTVCKYGFTTSHSVDKSSGQTWSFIIVYVDNLQFAKKPDLSEFFWCTPKNSSGAAVGGKSYVSETTAPWISIDEPYDTTCNHIYLRFDNPYPGNNAKSKGEWDGYGIQ